MGLSRSFKSTGSFAAPVAAAFAAKGIIQSPIALYNRMGHSVCQSSANSILKISGRRQCGLSAAMGWWDCAVQAKSDIYSCPVLSCFCQSCFRGIKFQTAVYDTTYSKLFVTNCGIFRLNNIVCNFLGHIACMQCIDMACCYRCRT